jgi:hypothetical protein
MRKILVLPALTLLALLAPVAAQAHKHRHHPRARVAHHVDLNRSSAVCALENNLPIVTVRVFYEDFEDVNKPVNFALKINGAVKGSGLLTWEGPDHVHLIKRAAPPGLVQVEYHAFWGNSFSGGDSIMHRTILCPVPVVPPVVVGCDGLVIPNGAPAPTCQTFVLVCDGTTMPAGTTTCPPPPPPPPPVTVVKVQQTACIPRRDVVFHTIKGSGTRLGVVKLYVHGQLRRVKDGAYLLRSIRFGSVLLNNPGRDGRVAIRIIAKLRKPDGSALEFRVRDRVKPCGATIRRDP